MEAENDFLSAITRVTNIVETPDKLKHYLKNSVFPSAKRLSHTFLFPTPKGGMEWEAHPPEQPHLLSRSPPQRRGGMEWEAHPPVQPPSLSRSPPQTPPPQPQSSVHPSCAVIDQLRSYAVIDQLRQDNINAHNEISKLKSQIITLNTTIVEADNRYGSMITSIDQLASSTVSNYKCGHDDVLFSLKSHIQSKHEQISSLDSEVAIVTEKHCKVLAKLKKSENLTRSLAAKVRHVQEHLRVLKAHVKALPKTTPEAIPIPNPPKPTPKPTPTPKPKPTPKPLPSPTPSFSTFSVTLQTSKTEKLGLEFVRVSAPSGSGTGTGTGILDSAFVEEDHLPPITSIFPISRQPSMIIVSSSSYTKIPPLVQLIAFNTIDITRPPWTFESVKSAIQHRVKTGQAIVLSFRKNI